MRYQLFVIIVALFFFNSFQAISSGLELNEDEDIESPAIKVTLSVFNEDIVIVGNEDLDKSTEVVILEEIEKEDASAQEMPIDISSLKLVDEALGNREPERPFSMHHLSEELENDPEFRTLKKWSDIYWLSNRLISHAKHVFGISAGITATIGEFWFIPTGASKIFQVSTTTLLWFTGVLEVGYRWSKLKSISNRKNAKKKIDKANYEANMVTPDASEKNIKEDSKESGPYNFKNIPEVLKNNKRFKYLRSCRYFYKNSSNFLGIGTSLSWALASGCSTFGLFGFGDTTTEVFRISTTLLVWFSGLLDRLEKDARTKATAAIKEMQRMLNQENCWYRGESYDESNDRLDIIKEDTDDDLQDPLEL